MYLYLSNLGNCNRGTEFMASRSDIMTNKLTPVFIIACTKNLVKVFERFYNYLNTDLVLQLTF